MFYLFSWDKLCTSFFVSAFVLLSQDERFLLIVCRFSRFCHSVVILSLTYDFEKKMFYRLTLFWRFIGQTKHTCFHIACSRIFFYANQFLTFLWKLKIKQQGGNDFDPGILNDFGITNTLWTLSTGILIKQFSNVIVFNKTCMYFNRDITV